MKTCSTACVAAIPPFPPRSTSLATLPLEDKSCWPSVCQPPAVFLQQFSTPRALQKQEDWDFFLPPPWSFWFVVLSHLALIYSGKIIRISLLWRLEWKCKQCFPAGGCFITLTGAFEFAWVADGLGYLCVSRTWKPRLWLGLWLGLRLGKRLKLCEVEERGLDLGENGRCWFWTLYLEWGCCRLWHLERVWELNLGCGACGWKHIYSCIEDGLGWYLHV